MTGPTSPEDAIRARALELGFSRCGFAAAGRSRGADRLDRWLAEGMHADLSYMADRPARRADPREVVPACRSVVVVTLDHGAEGGGARAAALPAEVARYARGRDYHRVAAVMLRKLKESMHGVSGPGHVHRWYVDDGPVLERSWAVEAGIGFAGKNACVIDPGGGSWFLLAVVLSTMELRADRPVAADCGTCAACIPACPTGAIVAPGVVDARKCISYWTIEHLGEIPEGLRPAIGTRVFGCDDCQAACPWNRFARPASLADLRPRELFADADLARLASLSEPEFDAATSGSAVRRAGYEGFMRNVAVALGNTGRAEAVPHVERLRRHGSELVRSHADWAAARLAETAR
ncbi:MAG: Epoxyqueuosine reductase [Planctomycetes bacterium]|nr:Epoxyqueuosine reductase [Planctomycetota bacterium]